MDAQILKLEDNNEDGFSIPLWVFIADPSEIKNKVKKLQALIVDDIEYICLKDTFCNVIEKEGDDLAELDPEHSYNIDDFTEVEVDYSHIKIYKDKILFTAYYSNTEYWIDL